MASDPERSIDFTRDIRPILSQHCFACHGPDENARQAALSLISYEKATADRLPDRPAIAPGDREASELWHRINDVDDPMPPVDVHNALSDEQIALLGQWIDEGASYAPHWAYVPPRRSSAPDVERADLLEDDIDRFIRAKLRENGLKAVGQADRRTLIRRLTYDLTGLPPTADEVIAFVRDRSNDAHEKLVDRLLASSHFGERMAAYWLDLVRYADTVGYHGDQPHRIWPYRDWVIEAFNWNVPFDQFTIEQLAGDLLPDATQDQLIATGYNRLLQTSHEGGVQLKEYRAIYQADRVRNVSSVWMGATVGCAQCHDHKYDPYTTRDFYSLAAFFADVDDEEHLRNPYDGLNTEPTARVPEMRVYDSRSRAEVQAIDAQIAELQQMRQRLIGALPRTRERWEAELVARIERHPVVESVWVDDQLDTGGRSQGAWTFTTVEGVPAHSGRLYRKQAGSALIQHYSVETTQKSIEVQDGDQLYCWVYLLPADPPQAVMLQFNTGGDAWQHRAVWGGDQIPYGRRDADWAGYQRMGPLPPLGEWTQLQVNAEDVGLDPGRVVSGIAFTQFGGTVLWDDAGVRTSAAPADVLAVLQLPAEERSDAELRLLHEFQLKTSPDVRACDERVNGLHRDRERIVESLPLTMYTRAMDEPREVRVLPRGNWLDDTGEVVHPAVPAFLGSPGVDGRVTRLDLARWLVTPEDDGGVGGLTARVFVNRVWALLFGRGLCPSLDDFGGQGAPPNHPELLDQLAIDFIDSGWDVKAVIRRLVLTQAYRQSSIPTQELFERDPENNLFGRQSRMRLPAEMVRDGALRISGLMNLARGGPPIKPPQPVGLYRHLNFPEREYQADTDENRYRRSVYMHWQRQFLHPVLSVLDAPTREECTAVRAVSNTPLAALALLNEPVFVEAAEALARRALADPDLNSDRSRIRFMMHEATCREASDSEVDVLFSLLEHTRRTGESHAWAQVARAILNLHEVVTRE